MRQKKQKNAQRTKPKSFAKSPKERKSNARLKNRIAELEEALTPFALYATAVWKKPIMFEVAKKKHQAIIASAFQTAAEVFWKPYGGVDEKTGHSKRGRSKK